MKGQNYCTVAPKLHPRGSNTSLPFGMQKLFPFYFSQYAVLLQKQRAFRREKVLTSLLSRYKEDKIQILLDSSHRKGNIKVVNLNTFFSLGFHSGLNICIELMLLRSASNSASFGVQGSVLLLVATSESGW